MFEQDPIGKEILWMKITKDKGSDTLARLLVEQMFDHAHSGRVDRLRVMCKMHRIPFVSCTEGDGRERLLLYGVPIGTFVRRAWE